MNDAVAIPEAGPVREERAIPVRSRFDSIDILRGLVMVVMALDHTRDYFTDVRAYGPESLYASSFALFLTRWITHFCAPTFVFLAGTGAFLSTTRGKSTRELSWFLFTRGLWLVLLEVTVIRWSGWTFSFDWHSIGIGVIWAIGWSMVVLAALVYLPLWAIIAFGVVMIAGHNLFDGVKVESLGHLG